jgi:NAD(P)-dependent dehydrogenase (short-subunit alcohol dehydrogenase family)
MFSKILAFELMENKIRVNTIALASVKTNFLKRYKKDANIINEMMEKTDKNMPFGIIKPNDVYELVKYLTKEGNKITGQTILMDSGVVLDVNKKK